MRTTDVMAFSVDEIIAIGKKKGIGENDWFQAVARAYHNNEKKNESEVAEFVTPLSDNAIPENLRETATKWRELAKHLDYNGPVCWRIRAGFTLKKHAPQAGPCYRNFQYLQDWTFADEPTKDALVFWLPRLVPGSTNKNVSQQKAVLAELCQKFGLPETHLKNFGSVGLVAGLVLAHHKATGERVPLEHLWARTDICHPDGFRLYLGDFVDDGLFCDWRWDGSGHSDFGVFALGVEELGL